EARSNADVFGDLCSRLGLLTSDEPAGELDLLVHVLDRLPESIGSELRAGGLPSPPCGFAPIQFVDVFPNTPDQKADLFPAALDPGTPMGLYRFQPDPATDRYPLALISPASERTISSTLGELPRPDVKLLMHPDDARARGLAENDLVRIFNELGEVHCTLTVAPDVRPGTVSLPKGTWRRSTRHNTTGTALVPDTLHRFLARLSDAEVKADAACLRVSVHEQAGNRIELIAHVDAHGANRRLIPESGTDRVPQLAQLEGPRIGPHVAGVDEQHAAEVATQHRAQLRAERQHAVAADREARSLRGLTS